MKSENRYSTADKITIAVLSIITLAVFSIYTYVTFDIVFSH